MGSAQQLTPFPRPLGVFPEFFAKQSETLVLREKLWSLSGNAFDIQLASGQSFLKVKGEAFSISNRMNVTDMSGKFLFCIRQKLLSLHTTYYAEDANGNEILEVRSKFKREFLPGPIHVR
ncbi:tubby C-terminal-like domain-containing protein [Durotheca rogersii]|uniref:tubby C-terminal-like domain-containing protein n=1 Tax=Durotheca rogersii TaxID=419775 RepID=UPI00221EA118|nr:tubby C-terminal-like domain-containing protein [Durotheca rogersii]KAI5865304.1 tubby C-terminal-like domain-containing protein [Durotheca rogersii]